MHPVELRKSECSEAPPVGNFAGVVELGHLRAAKFSHEIFFLVVREETSLTEPKHAASRQLVCDWADVSEDVLRLYVARRLQEGRSIAGLDRKALRELASPDDPHRTSCACCGDPLEGQSTKFCGKKCRQKQWLRDKAAAKRTSALD